MVREKVFESDVSKYPSMHVMAEKFMDYYVFSGREQDVDSGRPGT